MSVDKELVSKIHKELSKLKGKNLHFFKKGKRFEQFTQKKRYMSSRRAHR